MTTTWLTSDQHYGHNNIIKYCDRPFKDTDEMREILISNFNSLVKPDDIVYHLGDFSLSKRAPEEVLNRLNGNHHLIMGNHDFCHPVREKKLEKQEKHRKVYYDAGFKSLDLEKTIEIGGKQVLMCHLPYYDENPQYDQRYPQYRPKDEGLVLLHGHVHTVYKTRTSPKGSLMINVGVDVWGMKPVSLEEIENLIKSSTSTT